MGFRVTLLVGAAVWLWAAVAQPVDATLLALYEFSTPANSSDAYFYTVADSTNNSEGCLFGGSSGGTDDDPQPSKPRGWSFAGTSRYVRVPPTESLRRFGDTSVSTGCGVAFWTNYSYVSANWMRLIGGPDENDLEFAQNKDKLRYNLGSAKR